MCAISCLSVTWLEASVFLFLKKSQAEVYVPYKYDFSIWLLSFKKKRQEKKNDFWWSWMKKNFVSLMTWLSLVLCLLGAYCKANRCGLLFCSTCQELAGLGSHWVCVMHSFCPAPYCRSAEADIITLDNKAIPKCITSGTALKEA